APLRWAFRGALGARSRLVVRSSLRARRKQAKGQG
ncbi:dTDP-Rha--alpha-D-GlcNAc-pyrophosphate polyprenol alpha-3-L-rhamnosyltransferase, partial [Mycobacterium sp. ITM-2017-0098]